MTQRLDGDDLSEIIIGNARLDARLARLRSARHPVRLEPNEEDAYFADCLLSAAKGNTAPIVAELRRIIARGEDGLSLKRCAALLKHFEQPRSGGTQRGRPKAQRWHVLKDTATNRNVRKLLQAVQAYRKRTSVLGRTGTYGRRSKIVADIAAEHKLSAASLEAALQSKKIAKIIGGK